MCFSPCATRSTNVAHVLRVAHLCSPLVACSTLVLRVAQFKALDKALAIRKHPVIVAGDYNAEPDSPTMQLARQSGFIIPKLNPNLTWPADAPKVEIDYIVIRGMPSIKATSTVLGEQIASDHRPVVGVIQWP